MNEAIKVEKIDLSKTDYSKHPDIEEDVPYLAKIRGHWWAGKFEKKRYGWNFKSVFVDGFKLSHEGWEKLYRIVEMEVEE